MKGDTCNFFSLLTSFNEMFLHLIFLPVSCIVSKAA